MSEILELERKLQPYFGAPYKWTIDGSPADGPGAPFWYQQEVPTAEEVHREGCNCVGFVNILLGLAGSPLRLIGTRDAWIRVGAESVPVDSDQEIPPWSLLIGDYVDEMRQGHVAIVLEGGKILHCYVDDPTPREGLFGPGICIEKSWKSSHEWWRGTDGAGVYHGWVPFQRWAMSSRHKG
jgi:hypothetical protein